MPNTPDNEMLKPIAELDATIRAMGFKGSLNSITQADIIKTLSTADKDPIQRDLLKGLIEKTKALDASMRKTTKKGKPIPPVKALGGMKEVTKANATVLDNVGRIMTALERESVVATQATRAKANLTNAAIRANKTVEETAKARNLDLKRLEQDVKRMGPVLKSLASTSTGGLEARNRIAEAFNVLGKAGQVATSGSVNSLMKAMRARVNIKSDALGINRTVVAAKQQLNLARAKEGELKRGSKAYRDLASASSASTAIKNIRATDPGMMATDSYIKQMEQVRQAELANANKAYRQAQTEAKDRRRAAAGPSDQKAAIAKGFSRLSNPSTKPVNFETGRGSTSMGSFVRQIVDSTGKQVVKSPAFGTRAVVNAYISDLVKTLPAEAFAPGAMKKLGALHGRQIGISLNGALSNYQGMLAGDDRSAKAFGRATSELAGPIAANIQRSLAPKSQSSRGVIPTANAMFNMAPIVEQMLPGMTSTFKGLLTKAWGSAGLALQQPTSLSLRYHGGAESLTNASLNNVMNAGPGNLYHMGEVAKLAGGILPHDPNNPAVASINNELLALKRQMELGKGLNKLAKEDAAIAKGMAATLTHQARADLKKGIGGATLTPSEWATARSTVQFVGAVHDIAKSTANKAGVSAYDPEHAEKAWASLPKEVQKGFQKATKGLFVATENGTVVPFSSYAREGALHHPSGQEAITRAQANLVSRVIMASDSVSADQVVTPGGKISKVHSNIITPQDKAVVSRVFQGSIAMAEMAEIEKAKALMVANERASTGLVNRTTFYDQAKILSDLRRSVMTKPAEQVSAGDRASLERFGLPAVTASNVGSLPSSHWSRIIQAGTLSNLYGGKVPNSLETKTIEQLTAQKVKFNRAGNLTADSRKLIGANEAIQSVMSDLESIVKAGQALKAGIKAGTVKGGFGANMLKAIPSELLTTMALDPNFVANTLLPQLHATAKANTSNNPEEIKRGIGNVAAAAPYLKSANKFIHSSLVEQARSPGIGPDAGYDLGKFLQVVNSYASDAVRLQMEAMAQASATEKARLIANVATKEASTQTLRPKLNEAETRSFVNANVPYEKQAGVRRDLAAANKDDAEARQIRIQNRVAAATIQDQIAKIQSETTPEALKAQQAAIMARTTSIERATAKDVAIENKLGAAKYTEVRAQDMLNKGLLLQARADEVSQPGYIAHKQGLETARAQEQLANANKTALDNEKRALLGPKWEVKQAKIAGLTNEMAKNRDLLLQPMRTSPQYLEQEKTFREARVASVKKSQLINDAILKNDASIAKFVEQELTAREARAIKNRRVVAGTDTTNEGTRRIGYGGSGRGGSGAGTYLQNAMGQWGRDPIGAQTRQMAGYAAFMFVTMPVINTLKKSFAAIRENETAMMNLRRVINGTDEDLAKLGGDLTKVAIKYGDSITNVGKIQEEWGKTGYETAPEIAELTNVTELALNTADIKDADTAVKYLNSSLNQMGLSWKDAQGMLDSWNKTADAFPADTKDFAEAYQRSAAFAKNLGMDVNDLNAAISIMISKTGRSGKEVGNALRAIFSNMAKPKSLKTIEGMGIEMHKIDENGQHIGETMRPIPEIFEDLRKKFLEMDAVQANLSKSKLAEALGMSWRKNFAMALVEGWDRYAEVVEISTNSAGYSMKKNELSMQTLAKKMEQFKASAYTFAINMGEAGMLGFLKTVTDMGVGALGWINNLEPATKDLVTLFAALLPLVKAIDFGISHFVGASVAGFGGAKLIGLRNNLMMSTGLGGGLPLDAHNLQKFDARLATIPGLEGQAGQAQRMMIMQQQYQSQAKSIAAKEILAGGGAAANTAALRTRLTQAEAIDKVTTQTEKSIRRQNMLYGVGATILLVGAIEAFLYLKGTEERMAQSRTKTKADIANQKIQIADVTKLLERQVELEKKLGISGKDSTMGLNFTTPEPVSFGATNSSAPLKASYEAARAASELPVKTGVALSELSTRVGESISKFTTGVKESISDLGKDKVEVPVEVKPINTEDASAVITREFEKKQEEGLFKKRRPVALEKPKTWAETFPSIFGEGTALAKLDSKLSQTNWGQTIGDKFKTQEQAKFEYPPDITPKLSSDPITAKDQAELLAIRIKIADVLASTTAGYTSEGLAIAANSETVKRELELQGIKLEQLKELAILKNQARLDILEGPDTSGGQNQTGSGLFRFLKPGSSLGVAFDEFKNGKSLKTLKSEMDNYMDLAINWDQYNPATRMARGAATKANASERAEAAKNLYGEKLIEATKLKGDNLKLKNPDGPKDRTLEDIKASEALIKTYQRQADALKEVIATQSEGSTENQKSIEELETYTNVIAALESKMEQQRRIDIGSLVKDPNKETQDIGVKLQQLNRAESSLDIIESGKIKTIYSNITKLSDMKDKTTDQAIALYADLEKADDRFIGAENKTIESLLGIADGVKNTTIDKIGNYKEDSKALIAQIEIRLAAMAAEAAAYNATATAYNRANAIAQDPNSGYSQIDAYGLVGFDTAGGTMAVDAYMGNLNKENIGKQITMNALNKAKDVEIPALVAAIDAQKDKIGKAKAGKLGKGDSGGDPYKQLNKDLKAVDDRIKALQHNSQMLDEIWNELPESLVGIDLKTKALQATEEGLTASIANIQRLVGTVDADKAAELNEKIAGYEDERVKTHGLILTMNEKIYDSKEKQYNLDMEHIDAQLDLIKWQEETALSTKPELSPEYSQLKQVGFVDQFNLITQKQSRMAEEQAYYNQQLSETTSRYNEISDLGPDVWDQKEVNVLEARITSLNNKLAGFTKQSMEYQKVQSELNKDFMAYVEDVMTTSYREALEGIETRLNGLIDTEQKRHDLFTQDREDELKAEKRTWEKEDYDKAMTKHNKKLKAYKYEYDKLLTDSSPWAAKRRAELTKLMADEMEAKTETETNYNRGVEENRIDDAISADEKVSKARVDGWENELKEAKTKYDNLIDNAKDYVKGMFSVWQNSHFDVIKFLNDHIPDFEAVGKKSAGAFAQGVAAATGAANNGQSIVNNGSSGGGGGSTSTGLDEGQKKAANDIIWFKGIYTNGLEGDVAAGRKMVEDSRPEIQGMYDQLPPGVAAMLAGMTYDQAMEWKNNKYPIAHTGARVNKGGLAELASDERVLSPKLNYQFEKLTEVLGDFDFSNLIKTPGPQIFKVENTGAGGTEVKVNEVIHIDNAHFSDQIDLDALEAQSATQLKRSLYKKGIRLN